MPFLDGLNSEQKAAALDTEGAVLVTAGAGSGKTRLLTYRIAHIIEDLGVRPYNVLAITFTNKAAEEMRNRLQVIVAESADIWISTFHSMCAKILRRFADRLGYTSNFTIYATDESERAVKQIVKDMNLEGDNVVKTALHAISEAKNLGLTPDQYEEEFSYLPDIKTIVHIFEAYESKLKANNAMDFDDLLLKTHELFSQHIDVLDYYRSKFMYIHVDEFQDTNAIQYGLVRMLASKYGNIFAVGDEDQSIYGWRGADVTNMQSFIEDFGAKIYKLEQNYRSTKNILTAANNLIKNNVSRIDKKLWSDLGDGEQISCYRASTEAEEADFVVNTINKLLREGYRPHDFAVLMRVNALTRLLEQRFMQYNLPYKVYGGFKFFERKEVKDILAYLRILANPFDDDAILRVINFPKRGIGDGTIKQLVDICAFEGIKLFDALTHVENLALSSLAIKKLKPFGELLCELSVSAKMLTVAELTEKIIKDAKIREVYAEDTEENTARKLNIDDFLSSVHEFVNNRGGTLDEFLEEVTLYTEGDDAKGDCVFLSTVHSAKGMEFRNVFIIGVEEGLFPLGRASDEQSELEEERRLMYVAITRAKERLYITHCASRFMYGDRKMCRQSRFFGEIDERFVVGYASKAVQDRVRANYPDYASVQKSSDRISGVATQNVAVRQNNTINDYTVGTRVLHKKFGEGTIEGVTNVGANSYVVINFQKVGKITLSLAFAPITKL
ncbi:MAG: UvrD-helicase domain-containing protein [Clostridia bacterium]|nr:UvrD-helicase domain-containing protein [Clostridia bacterium]